MKSVFLRYPGGKAKAVTFSYDDGSCHDERLVRLFDDYGLKATFNFDLDEGPAFSGEQIRDLFLAKGHEIAVHGAKHRANGNLRPIEGIRDVLDCRLALEELCGCIIRGMAYPDSGINRINSFGSYAQIKNYLTELDIAYARTLGSDNNRFRLPEDFHAWMPSAHHDNPKLMEYIHEFLALDLSPKVYHARRYPRLLYIWGHSFEFARKNNWEHMEEICQKLSRHDDIWYATNIEIYDYVEGYHRLRFSADGHLVYNPNLFPVWLDVDGTPYCVHPGETIRIE